MSTPFTVIVFGAGGQRAKLFKEPDPESEVEKKLIGGFVVLIPDPGTSAEWVLVDHFVAEGMNPTRGWLMAWAVGDPDLRQAEPMTVLVGSFVAEAARLEHFAREAGRFGPRAEYYLALALIENDRETTPPGTAPDAEWTFDTQRSDPHAIGALAVTPEEWQAFLKSEGNVFGPTSQFKRGFPNMQLACIEFLTLRDWAGIAKAHGDETGTDYIPRRLDLFLARLIGVPASVEIERREREETGLDAPITDVLEAAAGLTPGSDAAAALLSRRARFLTDDQGPVTVATFLERARTALDTGLEAGFQMLRDHLPAFVGVIADGAAPWMAIVDEELKKWTDGGWDEKRAPGQATALAYFPPTGLVPEIKDASGEITDWCGAFVAFCLDKVGAPVVPGGARASHWKDWGDASVPARRDAGIPRGAVVVMKPATPRNSGHVCFFDDWTSDTTFRVIGGNQSDAVTLDDRRAEDVMDIRVLADKTAHSNDDLAILAKTLWGEIRGSVDSAPERVENVAHVILNRFQNNYRSGGTIASVCLRHKQYSCWNPGTKARRQLDALSATDPTLLKLTDIARAVLAARLGGTPPRAELAGSVHHYYAPAAMDPPGSVPKWARGKTPTLNDGRHLFFRGIA